MDGLDVAQSMAVLVGALVGFVSALGLLMSYTFSRLATRRDKLKKEILNLHEPEKDVTNLVSEVLCTYRVKEPEVKEAIRNIMGVEKSLDNLAKYFPTDAGLLRVILFSYVFFIGVFIYAVIIYLASVSIIYAAGVSIIGGAGGIYYIYDNLKDYTELFDNVEELLEERKRNIDYLKDKVQAVFSHVT